MRLSMTVLVVAFCLVCEAATLSADPRPQPRPLRQNVICDTTTLVGTPLPADVGMGACGVAAPVRLTEAAGVALEPPATVACETAKALAEWLDAGPKPDFAAVGERLEAIVIVDAYSCRGVNREAGAKLSEHAFGRAIDISGFRLGEGATVTILDGWATPRWSDLLRRIHSAGCGPFRTVLGPEANPLHADHLHLDVAPRRSGPWCE